MDSWKPSVFTPLSRRFENERAREVEDTRQLYRKIDEYHRRLSETPESVIQKIVPFVEHLPDVLQRPLLDTLVKVAASHRFIFEMPAFDEHCTLTEWADFRNLLRAKEYFFQNQDKVLRLLHEGLVRLGGGIADVLPKAEAPSPFTIPLIYALPEPGLLMTQMLKMVYEPQYAERGLFRDLMLTLQENVAAASGRIVGEKSAKAIKYAYDSDLPLAELNDTYLGGTPFHALFELPVPLKFTAEERFNHMHVVGGTGAGKTTLLEQLIAHDLEAADSPGLVIVDSQGDLIRKLSHLDVFHPKHGQFRDRLVLITPKDIDHPPALNIFDVNRDRLGAYDAVVREQVTAGVIQTFDYLFAGLLGADLTAKQGVFFKYVARLMLALLESLGRNATILDMLQLMDDPAPYRAAIERLPPLQRSFFERDFASKTFAQTKEQIRYRLQAIIENPTLARLFTAPNTKVDLFAEMNRGSIILVDTAKDFLKGASSHFGRIFISLVLQAVLERAAIPERERKPVFLIVDEAASYFDSNIDDLLTDVRKYRCGCVFAHQYLEQCTSSLRASFAANTSLKFASGVSNSDARAMATDMRTTAEFILSQPRLQFAAHIRNVTPQAVSIPVQPGILDSKPRLSDQAYAELLERNRLRVSLPLDSPEQSPSSGVIPASMSQPPGTDPSSDW
ncbi:MAG: type IV secretion system DNA-binding domain-containing protein [Proteobacteria bacterium]|nr:type IV secretion system DNA-binding domain-containing protein [Pseudomonadota bacterium]